MPDPDSCNIDYAIAFQSWMLTRIRLASAIQEYFEATAALSAAFLACPTNPSSLRSFNHTLTKLDQQLPSTVLDERQLQTTHSKLRMIRNRSSALVSINVLPPDILSTIFELALRSCLTSLHGTKTTLVAPTFFSGVCSSWRQLSLSMPSLWSHIDINLRESTSGLSYLRAGLWATRSQSAPLYIHVSYHDKDKSNRSILGATAAEFVAFLRPLIPRAASFEVEWSLSEHILGALSCWIRYGSCGSARQFKLRGSSYSNLRDELLSTNERITMNEFEAFFQPIRTLHLIADFIPLDSTIYHGLVELSIEDSPPYKLQPQHSQRQLAAILAACPKLRTLVLLDFVATPDRNFSPIPIPLNDLEMFTLQSSRHPSYIGHVLALIASSSPSIDMSLCAKDGDHPILVAEVHAFLARCRVTRLYVNMPSFSPISRLTTWLGHIPHVQTLAFNYFDIQAGTLQEYNDANRSELGVLDPWPRLQSLLLQYCESTQGHIEQLMSMHPLQELCILSLGGRGGLWGTDRGHEEFKNKLRASIPNVICGYNHLAGDPINKWDVVSYRHLQENKMI